MVDEVDSKGRVQGWKGYDLLVRRHRYRIEEKEINLHCLLDSTVNRSMTYTTTLIPLLSFSFIPLFPTHALS